MAVEHSTFRSPTPAVAHHTMLSECDLSHYESGRRTASSIKPNAPHSTCPHPRRASRHRRSAPPCGHAAVKARRVRHPATFVKEAMPERGADGFTEPETRSPPRCDACSRIADSQPSAAPSAPAGAQPGSSARSVSDDGAARAGIVSSSPGRRLLGLRPPRPLISADPAGLLDSGTKLPPRTPTGSGSR